MAHPPSLLYIQLSHTGPCLLYDSMIMKVFLGVTGWLPDLFQAQPSKSCLSPYAGLFCPGP